MSAKMVTVEELVAPARHVFLSPHYDDIPLSCGGTAAVLARNGRTPEIALVFGDHPDPTQPLTDFAHELHGQWRLTAEEVISARRAEEAVASAAIGAEDRYLPFRDAIYRGDRYPSNEGIFGATAADEAGLPAEILASLGITPGGAGVRVYAPLAIGNHVDHQHAFMAGVQLAKSGGEVWFYEDLPYALDPRKVEARIAEIREPMTVGPTVDVSSTWGTKIDAIMAYPSQLPVIFGYVGEESTREVIDRVMLEYSTAAGEGTPAERFWVLGTA